MFGQIQERKSMGFKLSDFVAKAAGNNGFSRRTHYSIDILLPQALAKKYDSKLISLMAISTNIPRVGLDTTTVRRGTTTNLETFPTGINFGDLSISFLSDGSGHVMNFMHDWMSIIIPTSGSNEGSNFKIAYKAEYVTKMFVKHYDPEGNVIAEYEFSEVYPESIGDIPMNWGAYDDIVIVPAEFKYTLMKPKAITLKSSTTPVGSDKPSLRTGLPVTPIIE